MGLGRLQSSLNSILGDGARSCKYKIQFSVVPDVFKNSLKDSIANKEALDFLCIGLTVPEIKGNYNVIHLPTAKKFNIPIGYDYNQDVIFTFLLDHHHYVREGFTNWIKNFSYVNPEGTSNPTGGRGWMHEHNLLGTIIVEQYDFDLKNATIVYTFHNVFPTSVGAIEYATDRTADIIKLSVGFNYTHYTREVKKDPSKPGFDVEGFLNNQIKKAREWVEGKIKKHILDPLKKSIMDPAMNWVKGKLSGVSSGMAGFFDFGTKGAENTTKNFIKDDDDKKALTQAEQAAVIRHQQDELNPNNKLYDF